MNTTEKVANRLINEQSPYLLQHAHNPVDWWPWCEKAFDKAKADDKPVFLSIGYSTCHWCHVMERESFEDGEVARLLNDNYIAIKVDREERPDVDALYMTACQAFTGSGGWPLTVLMTPDQQPFFAGTYFPKRDRYGSAGLMTLLERAARQWAEDREGLLRAASRMSGVLARATKIEGELSATMLDGAYRAFERAFDGVNGGFGGAPKFPTPHQLMFLLRYAVSNPGSGALSMTEKTLERMYRGGIYDHIGGGFSRYSTDARWLAPHFEKMLYDNALLLMAYAEAYQCTRRPLYRRVAESIIEYADRELLTGEGAFCCAQDADSEGEEGKYYTFTPDEIKDVLGGDADAFMRTYDITKKGNFEGNNIPNLLGCEQYEQTDALARAMKEKLYAYRLTRAPLHKDDKVLTSWNALMIAALAKAAVALDNDDYARRAEAAAAFIERSLVLPGGRIAVRWRGGETAGMGVLDDYAFLAWAYLELYGAVFDARYLERAARVAEDMIDLFWDEEGGGFFLSGRDAERLIARPKEAFDGALPSGNSVAGYVLARLARLTEGERFRAVYERQLSYLAGHIARYPTGHAFALMTAAQALHPSRDIVCAVAHDGDLSNVKKALRAVFMPEANALVKLGGALDDIAPFTRPYTVRDGRPTYYVCENGACRAPAHELILD